VTDNSPKSSGFLILNKPPGITSFEALGKVKKTFNTGRVGHTGTLDKFASGVLVALIGRYSRLAGFFMASEKTYFAGIRFGTETNTLDPDGEIIANAPIPDIEAVKSVLPRFLGEIMQAPPAYSAVHIKGKRAYERALSGEVVSPEARSIRIIHMDLLDFKEGLAHLRVVCSKGTYIRSLARDLAMACGSRAHLESLIREASGPFRIEDGISPSSVQESSLKYLDPTLSSSLKLPSLYLSPGQEIFFLRGAPLSLNRFKSKPKTDGFFSVFSSVGEYLGVIELKDGRLSDSVVLGGS